MTPDRKADTRGRGARRRPSGETQPRSAAEIAAGAVESVTETVVSTGIQAMQAMARLGQAAAEGAARAGERAGGAAGEMVAETARASAETAGRVGEASARATAETARTVSESVQDSVDRTAADQPGKRRARASRAARSRKPRAA